MIGITDGSALNALNFGQQVRANYPIIPDGEEVRKRFGVRLIWGTVTYLVNPSGEIVSQSMGEFDAILERELAPKANP
ncbi:MAG: hypothetical protein KDB07_00565 [Planctomycetes bacterium]|nr:hypothetical protein [Planctomycetota bacterium]